MAKKSLLTILAEGLLTGCENSYTAEEKEMIRQTRELLRRHNKTEAVKEIDKVIKDFDLGITMRK